jgi:drug/metabolite transporter (DMT)-like permease
MTKLASGSVTDFKSSSPSTDFEAYSLGLISVAAFALTLPCAKALSGYLSAIQIGIFRSAIAALVALPILYMLRAPLPNKSQIKKLLLTSLGIVYGFPILTAVGMQYVPVSHGGVVLAALPLSTAIFGTIITRERPPIAFWFAAIAGFALVATFAIVRNGLHSIHIGDLALLGAVVLAGYGYAQGGALSREMKGWQVMCWMLVVNLPMLLPLAWFTYDATAFGSLGGIQWSALGFLALVNSLLGFFSWNRALAIGGIQRISQLQLLQPFLTYVYSIVLMNEAFDWFALIMCVAVIALVVISKRSLIKK